MNEENQELEELGNEVWDKEDYDFKGLNQ